MVHQLDGYELKYVGRKSWKARVTRSGIVVAEDAPVTWATDIRYFGSERFLTVWIRDPIELREHRLRKYPYLVAVAEPKDRKSEKFVFKKFVALYEVVSTGRQLDTISIETRIVRRIDGSNVYRPNPQKVTRISYNSSNWRKPTGEASELEAEGTYNKDYGFGHEDWLFRDEWAIAGWRYAFIQGVHKSRLKLVEAGEPIDLTLFTVQPDGRRRYVARIRDVECLSDDQCEAALEKFKRQGWFAQMRNEIEEVGGVPDALSNYKFACDVLNVRFRVEDISYFPVDTFGDDLDPIMRWHRYMLFAAPIRQAIGEEKDRRTRAGSEELPNTQSYAKAFSGRSEISPEHAKMQKQLMLDLANDFPNALRRCREENFIDVLVETETDVYLYEIKSDQCPFKVLRHAIGQLLEYAFHQPHDVRRSVHLVAVGRNPLTPSAEQYLAQLQQKYLLPLAYRVVDAGL